MQKRKLLTTQPKKTNNKLTLQESKQTINTLIFKIFISQINRGALDARGDGRVLVLLAGRGSSREDDVTVGWRHLWQRRREHRPPPPLLLHAQWRHERVSDPTLAGARHPQSGRFGRGWSVDFFNCGVFIVLCRKLLYFSFAEKPACVFMSLFSV